MNKTREKILEILQYLNSDEIDDDFIEINNKHQVEEIDRILGKNTFIYYDDPNEARICLIHKKRNTYFVKMYWINHFLKIK